LQIGKLEILPPWRWIFEAKRDGGFTIFDGELNLKMMVPSCHHQGMVMVWGDGGFEADFSTHPFHHRIVFKV